MGKAGPEGPACTAALAQQQPQPSLQPQLLLQPQLPPQELPPQLPPQQQHRRMIMMMIHRQPLLPYTSISPRIDDLLHTMPLLPGWLLRLKEDRNNANSGA